MIRKPTNPADNTGEVPVQIAQRYSIMETSEKKLVLPHLLDSEALSIIQAIQGTNPGFSTHDFAYTENCQRCVAAYEARRRGYDVIAKPRLSDKADTLSYMISPMGWPAVYKNHRLENCSADTGEQAKHKVETLMRSYGDSSRAIVKVDWLMQRRGHLFMAENRKGVIYFVDPQTGSLDVAWYFSCINPHSVVVMRTDQAIFTDLIEQCVE